MSLLVQLKKAASVFLVALVCFGLLPTMQAVVPAPDGGYPAFNTAEGQNALLRLTTGTANTAVGWLSLENVTTGSFNTGVGAGTLVLNAGDQNTATGAAALLLNTTGGRNTANGALALLNNTQGSENTAVGATALQSNTGNSNTATGGRALRSNTIGEVNTATGNSALLSNTTGNLNTAIGESALLNNTTGSDNTALGTSAGFNVITATNVITIGNLGANVSNSCFIGNIRGTTTAQNNAIPVLIDMAGQLGTVSSSARFKKDIKPMENASEAIHALKPVTFHYKSDNTSRPEFGLIAEEVAKVNPDLVVRDDNGEIYTVRYDAVNAMLLNEFLKEHRRVQELEATVAQQRKDSEATAVRQQKQIEALTAGLQKVSAQLELNKSTPRTVNNNQ